MKTWLKVLLIIFIILIIAIVAIILFLFKGSAIPAAVLNIESGKVEVDTGNGWKTAIDGIELDVTDSIRTLEDGNAVLILYESVTVQLEPNTEINLEKLAKDSVSIKQNSGSTWNKFLGLVGMTSYSVTTPTTVATVRGTAFGVTASDNSSELFVGEGTVNLKDEDGGENEVNELKQLFKQKGIKAVLGNLTPEQKVIVKKHLIKDFKLMRQIRLKQVKNNKILMIVLKKYNVSEEMLPTYLKQIDSGEIDINSMIDKSPIKGQALENLMKLNDKIKEHRQLLLEKYGATAEELN